jgi:prolyl-tRNA synthetase
MLTCTPIACSIQSPFLFTLFLSLSSCALSNKTLAAEEAVAPAVIADAVAAAPAEGAGKARTPKVKAPQVPKVNKMAPKAKKEAASTGAVQIGIEYKKDVDFPKWYQQV